MLAQSPSPSSWTPVSLPPSPTPWSLASARLPPCCRARRFWQRNSPPWEIPPYCPGHPPHPLYTLTVEASQPPGGPNVPLPPLPEENKQPSLVLTFTALFHPPRSPSCATWATICPPTGQEGSASVAFYFASGTGVKKIIFLVPPFTLPPLGSL